MAKINLQNIPQKPGIYIFKDAKGNILYIGKANSLKSRVSSYFHKSSELTPHKRQMLEKIKKVEYIITSSETEALLLESNLIKKNQPPYNIDLKDDKNFLYIKITTNEDFPRVFTARKILRDKAKYFGPYVSAGSVRAVLHLLRKLFPHRNFTKPISESQLNFLIKRYPQLLGPMDQSEYRQTIERIINFLKGHFMDIRKDMQRKMWQAAENHHYEKAAALRDRLEALTKLTEKQKVVSAKQENQDLISLAREKSQGAVNLFVVRQGLLLNKHNFILKNTIDQSESEIIKAFIEQYYPQATDLPQQIIIPKKISNQSVIESAFKLKIVVPQKGVKRQYLELGRINAANYLQQQLAAWQKDETKSMAALQQFKQLLRLKKIPERIETFDISNIQGDTAVGSMVVFTHGLPDKKWYRKFKIKTVQGANDPAMMAEMVSRRFKHLRATSHELRTDWPKPDLVILDGGKGQLSAVNRAIKIKIPLAALAKQQEDIYLPGQKNPVNFLKNSEALFLIQRMRDEAHRFAITFFRKTHGRGVKKSLLDSISGIGATNRKKLIKAFGSALGVRDAGKRELAAVVGPKLAGIIKKNI